jgi:hypothetical protein
MTLDTPSHLRSRSDDSARAAVGQVLGIPVASQASFSAELYRAIALILGIDKLGETTTHSGKAGLGFAADTYAGRVVIIVDPSTGKLLEIQNEPVRAIAAELNSPDLLLAISTEGSNLMNQGISVGAKIEWSDSVGARSVVQTSAIPSDLQPPPTPVAVVVASAKPGIAGLINVPAPTQLNDPINTLERQLGSQFGHPGGGSGLSLEAGGYVLYLTFTGAKSQVQSWAQALHDSGLFVSVDINWGDVPTTAPGV